MNYKNDFKVPLKETISVTSKDSTVTEPPTINVVDFVLRRDTEPVGAYWNVFTPNGKEFSVVDCKTLFKSHPHSISRSYFSYWEAIELDSGELLSESLYRASTANELAQMIGKL